MLPLDACALCGHAISHETCVLPCGHVFFCKKCISESSSKSCACPQLGEPYKTERRNQWKTYGFYLSAGALARLFSTSQEYCRSTLPGQRPSESHSISRERIIHTYPTEFQNKKESQEFQSSSFAININ